jgi:hypothetical protein
MPVRTDLVSIAGGVFMCRMKDMDFMPCFDKLTDNIKIVKRLRG